MDAQFATCPLALRLSTRPKPSKWVMAGETLDIAVRIVRTDSKASMGHVGVSIQLPPGLCVLKTQPRNTQIGALSGFVFWPDVDFSKKKRHRLKVRTRVQSNYDGTTATFRATAFSVAKNCTAQAAPLQVRVNPSPRVFLTTTTSEEAR